MMGFEGSTIQCTAKMSRVRGVFSDKGFRVVDHGAEHAVDCEALGHSLVRTILDLLSRIDYLDNGVRNYFINNFNPAGLRADTPFLFEGFVISELIKAGVPVETIKFWRTKTRQEVDLVLDEGGRIKPIEIKFEKKLKPSDLKGLDRFKEAYPDCGPQFVVNLGSNRSPRPGIEFISPFSIEGVGHGL